MYKVNININIDNSNISIILFNLRLVFESIFIKTNKLNINYYLYVKMSKLKKIKIHALFNGVNINH